MACKNCGKENFDTSEYCMYCKQKLDNKIVKSNMNLDILKQEKPNKIKQNNKENVKPLTFVQCSKFLAIIISILLIVFLLKKNIDYDEQICLSKCTGGGSLPICACSSKSDTAGVLSMFGFFGLAIIWGIYFIIWLISLFAKKEITVSVGK